MGSELRLVNGQWVSGEGILPDEVTDLNGDLVKIGWERFWVVGHEDASPFSIETWRRRHPEDVDRWQYLVQVWDHGTGTEMMMVDGAPALLDLLARWSPIVQASAISQAYGDAVGGELSRDGFFEQLGARMAWGATEARPVMEREAKQELARRAQRHQQKEAERKAAATE